MYNVQQYLDLITSEHSDKPKFSAVVEACVAPFVSLQNLLEGMIEDFDINTAIGAQLDILGEWIGLSRYVDVPLTGIYFAFDDTAADGWDGGIWQGPFDPTVGLEALPDDIYRAALKAKILANDWDGSIAGLYVVYNALLAISGNSAIIQDRQNMTFEIGVVGATLPAVILALLTGGYFDIRPAGIQIAYYDVTAAPGSFFAFDCNSTNLQGWDEGQWAIQIPS